MSERREGARRMIVDLSGRDFALDADTARILSRAGASASTSIGSVEVPDTSAGLLIADGGCAKC